MRRGALTLAALLACAACSRSDTSQPAGGVTAGEARALDDAAAMVDSQQMPPQAMPTPRLPASQAPAPQPAPRTKP